MDAKILLVSINSLIHMIGNTYLAGWMVHVCKQSQQVHSSVGAEEMLGLALGIVDKDGETDSVGLTVGLELFTKLGFAVLVPLKHKSQSELSPLTNFSSVCISINCSAVRFFNPSIASVIPPS